MNSPEAHSLLLDRLSERLQGAPELWRDVFLGNTFADIRFEQRTLTLLRAHAPAGWSAGELVVLAVRFNGRSERLGDQSVLLSFEQPAQAQRAARALQELSGGTHAAASLSTEPCAVAWFQVDGRQRCVVLPSERVMDALPGE